MREIVTAALSEASAALAGLRADERAQTAIADAGRLLVAAFLSRNRLFSLPGMAGRCATRCTSPKSCRVVRRDRSALAAVAISDPGHITCTGNDYGFDHVFARYVEAHGREGDVLLAISTSGESRNVVLAADRAHTLGLRRVIGLTGKVGSTLGRSADVEICTPTGTCRSGSGTSHQGHPHPHRAG